jgi:signal transduction histidine kinase
MAAAGDKILLVDDDPAVLSLLGTALRKHGYECVPAQSGEDALEQGAAEGIDLAIVDVRLPGMDGVELTRKIKRRAGGEQFLPVIVVTGTDELAERVRAFEHGCDDFLTKPVNLTELQARVRSLLVRRREHGELVRVNERLRELQRKKQDLAALVVHDLRNPLSAIQGNLELLLEELAESTDFVREALGDCHKLAGRALFLVAGLLDVEELAEGLLHAHVQEVEVAKVVQQATPHHEATIRMRELRLEFDVPDTLRARMDPDLIGRLVENLLDNAVRYAPRAGRVVVRARQQDGVLAIEVGNDGPAVPVPERERIFGRYYRLEARRAGARANRGLGLYFCKLAAEAHGGTIAVEERDDLPTSFVLRLPQPC